MTNAAITPSAASQGATITPKTPTVAGISRNTNKLAVPTTFSTRITQAIEATIEEMKLTGTNLTLKREINIRAKLRRIARETKIFEPLEVKKFIAHKISLPSRNNYEWLYNRFAKANQIPYDTTRWKYTAPVPIIPTKEQVNTIINSATRNFYVPLTLLATIAVEGEELHRTHRSKIDLDARTISILGTKGHSNGVYKLSEKLTENLRRYLARHTNELPFPNPNNISMAWNRYRKRRAKELNRPELVNVQMKNLRNFAGAQQYLHGYTGFVKKDPIATMRFMRHKQLKTTMHYIQSINLDEPEEYKTVAIELSKPETMKTIIEYADAGYDKLTEADGYLYMRIRK